ncbi:MAG: tetratricopeptide repeat protein, partial [Candidatus Marinimicrobia bacterium]|nr:tetratricopeptide repeat protein [Candidatus Neomarinimicrobiota bacterium]
YSPVADPDIIYYSGKNDLRVGRVESAKHNFRWGIRNFPHRKVFHGELAKLLYGQQQYEPAIEPFEQLIALGDSTAGVYQHLGFCYYYTENLVRARNAFRKSFSKDPSVGLTAYYLAITERETGNLSSAIQMFEKAEQLSYATYLGELYTQMATAYQSAGDFNKSVWAYKQSMEFRNNPRNILFHIATLYDDDIQDPEKALEYYQKFLEHTGATKPENKNYAQERVSKLKTKIFLQN